jgi:hypothetical protein
MPRKGARITIRHCMAVIAMLALLLAFVILWVRHIERRNKLAEYNRVAHSLLQSITLLEKRVPQGVSPQVWAGAVRETTRCQYYVCFGTDRTSIEELIKLRDDLVPKLSGPVDVETLEWTWKRLARTNADGERFVRMLTPKFEAAFPRKDQLSKSR